MLNIITLIFYLAGGITQALASLHKSNHKTTLLYYFGLPAILLHSYLLYPWINPSTDQSFTEFNLFSLATWVTAVLITLLALHRPVTYLSIFVYPLAAASIFLANHYSTSPIIQAISDNKQRVHILMSALTFSVLCIAGLQAVTLAFQEKFVRHKHLAISEILPPVETMETLLFQIITVGCLSLTCLLATSIYCFHAVLMQQFLQKTVLTLITWVVFTLLLVGRHYFGWRGRRAVYCTLGGVALLSVIYFGSILIMEFLP